MTNLDVVKQQAILEELENIPIENWSNIWVQFNGWDWPNDFWFARPKCWTEMERNEGFDSKQMSEFIEPIMRKIENAIGIKKCNREWNRNRMTDEEHEKFWSRIGKEFYSVQKQILLIDDNKS